MEDFYTNITSLNNSYDYSNITSNNSNTTSDNENNTKVEFITYVLTCVIIGVGLPLTLMAIYCLYSQVQNEHVAPIYVINLLISDLIQLCCMIVEVAPTVDWQISVFSYYIYYTAVGVSVVFMVFIALERYLVVACPLWYHCRRTIKSSLVVCVLVWTLCPLTFVVFSFWVNVRVKFMTFSVIFLLPLPLFIFFLGGTLKALSATRIPSNEKRRIVGVLVLVLLIYTLLFLPNLIFYLLTATRHSAKFFTLHFLSNIILRLSPLADLTLYVFMRKGTIDKLLSSVCCCRMDRMDSDDTNSPSV